jgi:hypothetical protein
VVLVDKKAILLVIAIFALPPVNAIVGWDWNETPVGAVPQLQLYYPKSTHIVPEESAKAWEAFLDRYGANWRAEWNVETGTPIEISGYHYDTGRPISTEGEAEGTAWQFISDIQGLLKVNISNLALERISDLGEAGWRVVYQQHVGGVPVYNAMVAVLMTKDGKIDAVTNRFLPGIEIDIPVKPVVSEEEAVETAERAYRGEFNVSEPWAESSELVILPRREDSSLPYQLAWKVEVSSGSWRKRYFVDATGGWIIGGQDIAVTEFAGGLPSKTSAPRMFNIVIFLIGVLVASLILFAIIRRTGGGTYSGGDGNGNGGGGG